MEVTRREISDDEIRIPLSSITSNYEEFKNFVDQLEQAASIPEIYDKAVLRLRESAKSCATTLGRFDLNMDALERLVIGRGQTNEQTETISFDEIMEFKELNNGRNC